MKLIGVEKRKEQQYYVHHNQDSEKLLEKHIVQVFEGIFSSCGVDAGLQPG